MAETNTTATVTVQDVTSGKKDFLSLDFTAAHDRQIALSSMDQMQILARKLDIANPAQLDVLKAWIKRKHENILVLNEEQRCKELVDIYIETKFNNKLQSSKKENNPLAHQVSMMHSYTKELLVCYNYATKEGETVGYFDAALGIPVKLATEATVKIKVIDSLKLVKKIDVELDIVDLTMVVDMINNTIADGLRATMLEVVDKAKVSYYDIPKCYTVIKEALCKKVQSIFDTYGLSVADLKINDIYMTNDIDKQLENQYFALAKLARIKEFDHKQEEYSLSLYERKAKIQAAYPDIQLGLTEAEKDMALERYLKRVGQAKEVSVKVKEEVLEDRIDVAATKSTIDIKDPTPPQKYKTSNKHRIIFGVCAAAWLILSIALLASGILAAGLPILFIGLAALVGMGILFRYQLKYGVSKAVKDDYDAKVKAYNQFVNENSGKNAEVPEEEAAATKADDAAAE